jgi:exopolysaccharide biosynthesis protein
MKNAILQTEEDIIRNNNLKSNKENYQGKRKNKMPKWKKVVLVLLILALLGVGTLSFLLYGPWSGFRDWLITTAMTTMNHQYFATIFYNDEEIQKCLENNKVEESDEITDVSKVDTSNTANVTDDVEYANEYEKQILEHDEDEDYKIIEIEGDGYDGYLAVIYDPSKVKAVVSKNTGSSGQYLVDMAKQNEAQIAINGGGFFDETNGAEPMGITIVDGEVVSNNQYTNSGGLIGFTEDNKLVLGRLTVSQAKAMKIRDAVSFGPYLIVNGKASRVVGNGGWGTAPRTAIGKRQDGIVLFLVINGRTTTRPGAGINDMIDIFERYGAYNAANLDGGTSSAMVEDGEIISDPVDASGNHRTRHIASAFILTK